MIEGVQIIPQRRSGEAARAVEWPPWSQLRLRADVGEPPDENLPKRSGSDFRVEQNPQLQIAAYVALIGTEMRSPKHGPSRERLDGGKVGAMVGSICHVFWAGLAARWICREGRASSDSDWHAGDGCL